MELDNYTSLHVLRNNIFIERLEYELSTLTSSHPKYKYLVEQIEKHKIPGTSDKYKTVSPNDMIKTNSFDTPPEKIISTSKDMNEVLNKFHEKEYSKAWHFIQIDYKINKLKEFIKDNELKIKEKYPDRNINDIEEELVNMIKNKQLKTVKEIKYDKNLEKIIKITINNFNI